MNKIREIQNWIIIVFFFMITSCSQERFYNEKKLTYKGGRKMEKLEFQIGIAHWEGGKTTLQITRDGQVMVKNEYIGTIKEYHGKITEEAFRELITIYNENKIGEIKSNREFGIPDESMIHLIVYTNGQKSEISLWENEARENKQFNLLLNKLEFIIKDVSKGEVY